MPKSWEVDESAPPEAPPPESLEGGPVGELTDEDADTAAAGVTLPDDAEGDLP